MAHTPLWLGYVDLGPNLTLFHWTTSVHVCPTPKNMDSEVWQWHKIIYLGLLSLIKAQFSLIWVVHIITMCFKGSLTYVFAKNMKMSQNWPKIVILWYDMPTLDACIFRMVQHNKMLCTNYFLKCLAFSTNVCIVRSSTTRLLLNGAPWGGWRHFRGWSTVDPLKHHIRALVWLPWTQKVLKSTANNLCVMSGRHSNWISKK